MDRVVVIDGKWTQVDRSPVKVVRDATEERYYPSSLWEMREDGEIAQVFLPEVDREPPPKVTRAQFARLCRRMVEAGNTAYRTMEAQERLYELFLSECGKEARSPGSSSHLSWDPANRRLDFLPPMQPPTRPIHVNLKVVNTTPQSFEAAQAAIERSVRQSFKADPPSG